MIVKIIKDVVTKSELILGVCLIMLIISGNYLNSLLGCKMHNILHNNIYAKHVIILLTIYFSITIVNKNIISPITHLSYSILIWVFFLIFNKMNFNITMIVFAIFCTILICKEWIDYYQATDAKKYQNEIRNLNIASEYLIITALLIITVGFALYFKKQHTDHFKNFSFITFILGTANNPVKC
jgi:hypothetical protein